jgi:transposase
MLKVAEINYIRFLANTKGLSYAEIARQLDVDPRTVKKYVEQEDWSPTEGHVQQRKARVMDPVKPIIDQWLAEDMKKNKKYRRTAKRMFDMLCSEHSFRGSYRSVRAYVSKKKKELLEDKNGYLPLEAKPGTAQVDFGETPFKYKGQVVKLSYLVLSFPYSNSFYFQVFKGQNKECFLEGLKRIFNHLGGVPKTIRFDNLSPAVKKVLANGERELTEDFYKFTFHYGFDYEFCNPRSGNEKGHCEAMVKYIRNNFLLPEPHVNDLEVYNQFLWQAAENDRQRLHYKKEILIADLFNEDREQLLMLPTKEYEVGHYVKAKADKYGKINLDKKLYSTSPRYARSNVLVRVTYNRIEVLDDNYQIVVAHDRLYGKEKESMKWQPYLSLMAKRPMALKYTSFYDQLPLEWQQYFNQCTKEEKQEILRLLAALLKENDMDVATKALITASKYGHPTPDTIKQIFIQIVQGRGVRESLDLRTTIPAMPPVTRDLDRYDYFMGRGMAYGRTN